MTEPAGARYLTAQQVADRYEMDIRWVYGCRTLPRRKLGKSLRFLESELETWEKRHTGNTRVYPFHHSNPTPIIRRYRDYLRAVPPSERSREIATSLQALEAGLAAFTSVVKQHIKVLKSEQRVEAVEPTEVAATIAVVAGPRVSVVPELAGFDDSRSPGRPDDLTVADVCKLQNVKPEVVQRWIRLGYLPAQRRSTIRGKKLFVATKDYQEFARSKRVARSKAGAA